MFEVIDNYPVQTDIKGGEKYYQNDNHATEAFSQFRLHSRYDFRLCYIIFTANCVLDLD